jgi:hypothetical protein
VGESSSDFGDSFGASQLSKPPLLADAFAFATSCGAGGPRRTLRLLSLEPERRGFNVSCLYNTINPKVYSARGGHPRRSCRILRPMRVNISGRGPVTGRARVLARRRRSRSPRCIFALDLEGSGLRERSGGCRTRTRSLPALGSAAAKPLPMHLGSPPS